MMAYPIFVISYLMKYVYAYIYGVMMEKHMSVITCTPRY